MAGDRQRRIRDLQLAGRQHLCEVPDLLRGHGTRTGRDLRYRRRAAAANPRGFGDHRPHLSRRFDPAGKPGGRIPAGTPDPSRAVQFLRLSPGQPRSDDARHLCQYPHPQRNGAGRRRRRDHAPAVGRTNAGLRCGDEIRGGRRAAGHRRRQRIRHRFVARLGSQRHHTAGRQGGDRRKFRTYSPVEPNRHGRAAAAVHRRRYPRNAGSRRYREVRYQGRGRGPQPQV